MPGPRSHNPKSSLSRSAPTKAKSARPIPDRQPVRDRSYARMEANDEDDYSESDVEPMEIPRPTSYPSKDDNTAYPTDEEDHQTHPHFDESEGTDQDSDMSGSEPPSDDGNEYSENESDDEGGEEMDLERLKEELANVPFDQLLEIQQKVGLKTFHANFRANKKMPTEGESHSSEEEDLSHSTRPKKEKLGKDGTLGLKHKLDPSKKLIKPPRRQDKNMPTEVTSKRPVPRHRTIIPEQKPKHRDPRFDPLAGHLNPDLVKKSYGFLKDYEKSEMEMLKKQIAKTKDAGEREKLEAVLLRMTSRARAQEAKEKRDKIVREHKKKEAEAVAKGKKPFYLKQSKIKELELKEKFDNLKAKGKDLDKYLEKRRKKNASREKRFMPYKRRSAE